MILHWKDETCWKYSKLLQYIYFNCDDTAVNKKYNKYIDINYKQHLFLEYKFVAKELMW